MDRQFSVTRTKATWKPRVNEEGLAIFTCDECGDTFLGIGDRDLGEHVEPGRNKKNILPYTRLDATPVCSRCNQMMSRPQMVDFEELPDDLSCDYQIVGGYNNNAVKFSWKIKRDDVLLIWVMLKTFTGSQVKYVMPGKRSPIIFALADEDAYAYCDQDPCQECIFRCKRGFEIYAYFKGFGIVVMPFRRAQTPQKKN